MQSYLTEGELVLRLDGSLDAREAERVDEAVRSTLRLSRVTLDLARVRDFRPTALVRLARTMRALAGAEIRILGLTLQQACALQECAERATR